MLADVNPNPLVDAPRLANRLRAVAATADRLPRPVIERGERRLRARISAGIADRFGPSNAHLAQLTGLDLGYYGYLLERGPT